MTHDLQFDVDVLLPDAVDARDRCVSRVVDAMEATVGVRSVHVVDASEDGTSAAKVCLHVDGGGVSLERVAARARAVGAEISARFGHVVWNLAAASHVGRADTIAGRIRDLPGVLDASVGAEGVVRIEFDRGLTDEMKLRDALRSIGVSPSPPASLGRVAPSLHDAVEPSPHPPAVHDGHDHEAHSHGSTIELRVVLGGAVLFGLGLLCRWVLGADDLGRILHLVAFGVTGVVVGRDAWQSVRARRFDIDLLMLVAAIGAASLGEWSDAALLLVLFSLGHALEGYAMGRARRAIAALSSLAPETATRLGADGVTTEVPLSELAVGDMIVVRPNERIAADGVVRAGTSTVDESPVTGESIPVEKSAAPDAAGVEFTTALPAHRVFASTLNGLGALEVVVARRASESTLARVMQLVADAETQVAPSQQLTRRIVRVFVPAVLGLAVGLLVVGPLLGEPFDESLLRAMAVLVAASPCALAIATPSAVLASIARSAREGVLVKGGGPLEELARVRSIAFDKTGTLTEGRPRLTLVGPVQGADERELLTVALAVERLSDHPLARAVTAGAVERLAGAAVPVATEVSAVDGKGVVGVVEGARVTIGNRLMHEGVELPGLLEAMTVEAEAAGQTTMLVRRGDRFLGVLGVMDTPRADAPAAIAALRSLGVADMVMLSGDNQRVADAIANQVGLSDAKGGLLPEQKVDYVVALRRRNGHAVAMVGDGVNDAPALATANVGIAMGAAGSDVALETADVALLGDELDRLPFALALAVRARRVIRQNLFFSLAVVAVLIPLTIAGVGIGPAVIAHEGSTLVVVGNALALLAFRARRD